MAAVTAQPGNLPPAPSGPYGICDPVRVTLPRRAAPRRAVSDSSHNIETSKHQRNGQDCQFLPAVASTVIFIKRNVTAPGSE